MAGIFNQAFGGGLNNGMALADKIQQRRDRSKLEELADLARGGLGNAGVANQVGAGLIGLGQVNSGINTQNVPYQREQQQLQRDFQNQQFEALTAHRDRTFNNQLNQQGFQNDLASQRLDLAREQAARQAERGGDFTTPFQAVDENGNQVFLQANDRGDVRPIEGFSPNNSLTKVDAGDKTLLLERSGNVVSTITNDNFTPARDKAAGTATGKNQTQQTLDAPKHIRSAQEMINVIDGILQSPNLESSVGVVDGNLPDLLSGQGTVDFRARAAQLEGKAFLEAFQSLKGGGPITDVEGKKATEAIGRLSQTQSPEAYRAALNELKEVVSTVRERAVNLMNAPRIQATRPPSNFSNEPNGGIVEVTDDLESRLSKYD